MGSDYPTLRRRFSAFCLDAVVLSPAPITGTWLSLQHTERAFVATCLASISICVIAYWVLLHGLYGQTLGKRLCGILVLDVSETKLSMKQAVLRVSPGIVFLLLHIAVAIFLIQSGSDSWDHGELTTAERVLQGASRLFVIADIVTLIATNKRRAVHDLIAGSVVVHCEKRPQPAQA